MKYGPFPPNLAEEIKHLLDSKSIKHEMILDQETQKKELESYNQDMLGIQHRTNSYEGSFVYFEIDPEDFSTAKVELEKLGIVHVDTETDEIPKELQVGEEFFCPKCDFIQEGIGVCKKHNLRLISGQEKNELHASIEKRNGKIFMAILLGAALIALLAKFIRL
jgi:hypothetical protein